MLKFRRNFYIEFGYFSTAFENIFRHSLYVLAFTFGMILTANNHISSDLLVLKTSSHSFHAFSYAPICSSNLIYSIDDLLLGYSLINISSSTLACSINTAQAISGGGIVGIILGSLAFLVAIIIGCVCCYKKYKKL